MRPFFWYVGLEKVQVRLGPLSETHRVLPVIVILAELEYPGVEPVGCLAFVVVGPALEVPILLMEDPKLFTEILEFCCYSLLLRITLHASDLPKSHFYCRSCVFFQRKLLISKCSRKRFSRRCTIWDWKLSGGDGMPILGWQFSSV